MVGSICAETFAPLVEIKMSRRNNWPDGERSGNVMRMCSFRRYVPFAMCIATFLPLVITSPASAASVSYEGMCARSATIIRWTPKEGAVARFVADAFAKDTQTGLWIGLGRDGTSFWSAEGGEPNDACDDCRILRLVQTRADGTRKVHKVFGAEDTARIGSDPAARKAHVLATLWKLAKDTWPADKLTQDYALAVGKPETNVSANQRTFAVKVFAKNKFDIRYEFGATTSMCWCFYEWNARSRR